MSNSRLRCKHCREYFPAKEAIKVPAGTFCGWDHATRWSLEQADKKKKKAKEATAKKERARVRQRKQELKKITTLVAEAETQVRRYVRARDRWFVRPCPSCTRTIEEVEQGQGWKIGGAWDAGHYRSKAAAKQLRFNLLNIWRQCKSCNAGDGKYRGKAETVGKEYRLTLIDRIGLERVEALDNNHELAKWSREYLERMKSVFSKRARMYEKRLRVRGDLS